MDNNQLRERLEELHLALLKIVPENKATQKKIDELAAHIREALDNDDLQEFHVSLLEMLEERVISFEEKHPKVTALMNSIAELLSSMGI